jgi:hypothetical protein
MTDVKPSDLDRIANWPLTTQKDYVALMTYVRGLWSGQGRWDRTEGVYELHATEDDEDLIESLRDNALFWATCWESSNRHGTHVFRTP